MHESPADLVYNIVEQTLIGTIDGVSINAIPMARFSLHTHEINKDWIRLTPPSVHDSMMSMLAIRAAARGRLAAAVIATSILSVGPVGCIDKPAPTEASAAPTVLAFRVAMNVAPQFTAGGRIIDVKAAYARKDGDRVTLTDTTIAASVGTLQVALRVDIQPCLADDAREGNSSGCPLRVTLALRDSTPGPALDSTEAGPFNTAPGQPPTVPSIDLATARFGVRAWAGDDALSIGNPDGGTVGGPLFGIATGSAAPTIYAPAIHQSGVAAIAVFRNGAWQFLTSALSPTIRFARVVPVSQNEFWIAARGGLFRSDGTTFTPIPSVTDTLLSLAVLNTGGTGRRVFAVGIRGALWDGDGSTFTKVSLGTTEDLSDVCITGPNEAWIAGLGGTIWRFNGTTWTVSPTPSTFGKSQLQCPAPGQAFVMAQSTTTGPTQLLSWTGSAWTTIAPLSGASPASWSAVSPSEIYLAADSAIVRQYYVYNGTSWRQVARSSFTQAVLGVWADPRGGAAYAMSAFNRLEQFTSAGTFRTLSYTPSVRDVIMTSATSAFAVGWNLFLARWNGQSWSVDQPPANTPTVRILQSVWSDGPSNAWAVGNTPTILHWNGAAWSVVSDISRPIAGNDSYNAVWGQGSTALIAGASIVRCTSVTTCARDNIPTSSPLYGLWGTALSNVYAVGAGGLILHFDGNAWSTMPSPTSRTFAKVWGSSATDVWAVGDSVLVHFDGSVWKNVPMTGDLAAVRSSQPSPVQGIQQIGLWGTGPNDVYVGGEGGQIARFDGKTWHLMPTSSTHRVLAISGAAGVGAFALTTTQAGGPGQALLRGAGSNGGLSAPTSPASVWP